MKTLTSLAIWGGGGRCFNNQTGSILWFTSTLSFILIYKRGGVGVAGWGVVVGAELFIWNSYGCKKSIIASSFFPQILRSNVRNRNIHLGDLKYDRQFIDLMVTKFA